MSLKYEKYNTDRIAVWGDKEKYGALIKGLGGRWNSRMKKGGPGWLLPSWRENEIQKLISACGKKNSINL